MAETSSSIQPADVRSLFPVTREYAYLDHATLGTLPQAAVDAEIDFFRSHAARGSEMGKKHLADKAALRAAMATFIGAKPEEIAYTKSTSESISIVANGIDWR